jgi:hypothetical protein
MDTHSLITRAQDAIKRIESAHVELLALVQAAETQAQKLEGASVTLRKALDGGEGVLSASGALLEADVPAEVNASAVTLAVQEGGASEATAFDESRAAPAAEAVPEEPLVEAKGHEHDLFETLADPPVGSASPPMSEGEKSSGRGRRGKATPSKPLAAAPAKTQSPQPAFGAEDDIIDF